MKTLTVHLAPDQLTSLMTDAHDGDLIVLTDGERQLVLQAGRSDAAAPGPEEGRPELAAAFLLGQNKQQRPKYTRQELEEVAEELKDALKPKDHGQAK